MGWGGNIRNLPHAHAGRHRGAHAHGEVDIVHPRHVRSCENLLADLRALLGCQLNATLLAVASLLGCIALPALLLASLALLTLTSLLVRLRLSLLALLALTLTGG